MPEVGVLCLGSKCLRFGRTADEGHGYILPRVVMMRPPVDGRFSMCKFFVLDLLVLSVSCMIALNHIFTHANVDGMIGHGKSYICDPL